MLESTLGNVDERFLSPWSARARDGILYRFLRIDIIHPDLKKRCSSIYHWPTFFDPKLHHLLTYANALLPLYYIVYLVAVCVNLYTRTEVFFEADLLVKSNHAQYSRSP